MATSIFAVAGYNGVSVAVDAVASRVYVGTDLGIRVFDFTDTHLGFISSIMQQIGGVVLGAATDLLYYIDVRLFELCWRWGALADTCAGR